MRTIERKIIAAIFKKGPATKVELLCEGFLMMKSILLEDGILLCLFGWSGSGRVGLGWVRLWWVVPGRVVVLVALFSSEQLL